MPVTLFTATGCLRCTVLKRFLDGGKIAYEEKDVKEQGKPDFVALYAQSRLAIHRGKEGIEFPILVDGTEIRQGLGPTLAYMIAGKGLDGYVRAGTLTGNWIDGLSVSGGDPDRWEDFLAALRHLRGSGMKVELHTDGRQAWILEKIRMAGQADRVVMDVLGPPGFYQQVFGNERMEPDVLESLGLVTRFPEYGFRLVISVVLRSERGTIRKGYLTPKEIGEAARMIREATGSHRHPCFVAAVPADAKTESRSETLPPLSPGDLFRFRSEARRFQVFTEIEKPH